MMAHGRRIQKLHRGFVLALDGFAPAARLRFVAPGYRTREIDQPWMLHTGAIAPYEEKSRGPGGGSAPGIQ